MQLTDLNLHKNVFLFVTNLNITHAFKIHDGKIAGKSSIFKLVWQNYAVMMKLEHTIEQIATLLT